MVDEPKRGGRSRTGELRFAGKRWTVRFQLGDERFMFGLETCRDPNDRAAADLRARSVRQLLEAFDSAGVLDTPDATKLLHMAASDAEAMLPTIRNVAGKLINGTLPPPDAPSAITFGQLSKDWTSGKLHREWPDHVALTGTADQDAKRLEKLCEADVGGMKLGDVPIDHFTLDHAERTMRQLDKLFVTRKPKRPATRRHYAQLMNRVLGLAVYPCRIIAANPIPKKFMPKAGKPPAFPYLYPSEDRALLRCTLVPFIRRLYYGVLAREGLRASEAIELQWRDVDLERGVLTLTENKTDDPRAWALGEDVARGLSTWKRMQVDDGGEPDPDDYVFAEQRVPIERDGLADRFRKKDLRAAQVTRHELFASSDNRRPVRIHDLRGTFVTLALANGKTETWVSDRTGHRSSQMINRYRRAARSASELNLGWLAPLDEAIPELAASADHTPSNSPQVPPPVGEEGGSRPLPDLGSSTNQASPAIGALDASLFNPKVRGSNPRRPTIRGGENGGQFPTAPPRPGGRERWDRVLAGALRAAADDVVDELELEAVAAFERAIAAASEAKRWDVVGQLARLLEAKRRESTGVVELDAERAKRSRKR